MAARKKAAAKKKGAWGGPRSGSGRKKGKVYSPYSGDAPRINRVAIMLSDKELCRLKMLAKKQGVPTSSMAYLFLKGRLR